MPMHVLKSAFAFAAISLSLETVRDILRVVFAFPLHRIDQKIFSLACQDSCSDRNALTKDPAF